MDRIRVVGPPGSGKTTTAAAIAARLGIPHLELDDVHWLPEWRERDVDDFRSRVLEFAAQPRWVMDGNYQGRLGSLVDDHVDTFVWLDPPRWRVVARVVVRTVRRAATREALWTAGNRERIRNLFSRDPTDNLALWAWRHHGRYRARSADRAATEPERWVRLATFREIDDFIRSLPEVRASD